MNIPITLKTNTLTKNNMKDKFVTPEIALKLKELGFDEPCFGYFAKDWNKTDEKLFIYQNEEELHCERTEAPLWQDVIDMFREKYALLIDSPVPDRWNDGNWSVRVESMNKMIVLEAHVGQPYWRVYRCFDSYQDAREKTILIVIDIISKL